MMYKFREEFPNINGLQDTLPCGLYLNDKNGQFDIINSQIPRYRPLPQRGFFAQILHLNQRNHWICIAGYSEPKKTISIDVYDSMNSYIVDHELISQVSSFFKCHDVDQFEFVFHRVTYQLDGSSCGVHAIANTLVLCTGGFPDCHFYNLENMRPHLIALIENGDHSELFDSETIVDRSSRVKKKQAQPVFCYCREIEDGSEMVQCNRCFEWFHFKCLMLDISEIEKKKKWYCNYCSQRVENK